MPLKLKSTGGGDVTLDVPSTASALTATVPAQTGTLGMMKLMTAQTASGTSVDFTGIPSWVKRITLQMRQVSFAAAGTARVRLGTSSGLTTTGYSTSFTGYLSAPTITVTNATDGIGGFTAGSGTVTIVGSIVITLLDTDTWVSSGMVFRSSDNSHMIMNGHIALSGTLDRISLVATASTFDAGTINVLYEG